MLKSTFQHIKGVGRKTERSLWAKGFTTWDEYEKSRPHQCSLFNDSSQEQYSFLHKSRIAYKKEDIAFFSKALSTAEYYRLALEFPNEVLFLDIETTGLSFYYDIISIVGWSIGKKFEIYINGQDPVQLKKALKNAKVLVTFNGIMFDLKFINKYIKPPHIPPVHIDLRFFSKRIGLSGGQKAIEQKIGYKRQAEIEDMRGEAAPILWHKYRRGDTEALRRLIKYNHDDVEGMKKILDYSIEQYFKKEKIPKKIRKKPEFSKHHATIQWTKNDKASSKIYIPPFTGNNKPLITYKQLDDIYPLNNFCAIGIDLVSSEDRETGFCILNGNNATTCRVKTDNEIIQFSIENGVDIVSIDSPLSIPKGRTSFFDDDPYRDEYGITRECERMLKRRGISSYPCLIPSMQKLTRRGMALASKFRALGIPVIESYPGAAQDIMSIPRKQAGLDYLVGGLNEFGLKGPFVHESVSHDELDAITSAIVGHFFWVGMYEGLGNPDEEYLIIPDLNADYQARLSRNVIGLSGDFASGKSTVAKYLKNQGFSDTKYGQILKNMLRNNNTITAHTALQKLSWEGNQGEGQRWIGKKYLAVVENKKCFVVDGLCSPEDHALMLETYGPSFKHIYIKASMRNRMQRNNFKNAMKHSIEEKTNQLERLAHQTIYNNGTVSDLFSALNNYLGEKKKICQ